MATANTVLLAAIDAAPADATHLTIGKVINMRSNNTKRAIDIARKNGQVEQDSLTLTPEGKRLAGVTVTPAAGNDGKVAPNPAETSLPATLQFIPLNQIDRNPDNYRKTFDEEKLAELAQSIKERGLMQPIGITPYGDLTDRYLIVIGERRWRAMQLLVKAGDWPADNPVPTTIRTGSAIQILEDMITENSQREDVHPIEEATAIAKVQELYTEQDGKDARDVCGEIGTRLGKSRRWAERRVKMVRGLSDACATAYLAGEFTSFAIAEVLARFPHDAQDDALEAMSREWAPLLFASEVKEYLEEDADEVGDTVFTLEAYEAAGGTFIEPAPGSDAPRLFANKAIADQLTVDWIAREVAQLTETHGYTTDPINENWYREWDYPKATEEIPQEFHAINVSKNRLNTTITHPVYDRVAYAKHLAKNATLTATDDGATIKPISKTIWEKGSAARTEVLREGIADDPRVAMALALLATFDDCDEADRSIVRIKPDGTESTPGTLFDDRCKPALKHLKLKPKSYWEDAGEKVLKCTHRGKALAELLARDDVPALFAARMADLTCDSRYDHRAGAMQESITLHKQKIVADTGHAPVNLDWVSKYTKAQQGSVIDAYKLHADISGSKKAAADQIIHKAWPDGLTPIEARFLDPKQAEAAATKLLQGKKP